MEALAEENRYLSRKQERFDIENLIAGRTKKIRPSAIREILKVVSQPGMVSLAGGIPSPECIPLEIIRELSEIVINKYGARVFQYDKTEGFDPLRKALFGYLRDTIGLNASPDEIIISSGSQGMLDLIAKVLISEGDGIVVEAPTYIGAVQAFDAYGPKYLNVCSDDDGPLPEDLEVVIRREKVKLIYLVPTFQNPTGRTISFERREEIAGIIRRNNLLLIEDDPYGALRYRGRHIPPIKTFAPDNVVYVGSLSKVFAPGLRLGFSVAPSWLRKWLVIAKQGVDLHTNTFGQALAAEYLSGGHLQRHQPGIISTYRSRNQSMINALEKYFPDSFKWSRPEGGMFLWVEGPEGMDMEKVYQKAIKNNVAFVPGRYFFTREGEGNETMRLNFTMCNEDKIEHAVKILSGIIKAELS